MNKARIAALGVLAATALLGAGRAEAAGSYEIDYSVQGADSLSASVHRATGQTFNNVKTGTVTAKWHVAGSKPDGYADQFRVYCVDIGHVSVSPSTVSLHDLSPGSPVATNRLLRAAWLFNQFGGSVDGASGTDRQKRGAALQLAIWNVMDEDDLDVTTQGSGRFYVKSAGGFTNEVSSLANSWLTALGSSNFGSGTLFKIDRGVMGTKGQDMIGPSLVPEPGSMVLLLSGGLACIGGIRRRKRLAAGAAEAAAA
jgi:hypothetical protein